MLAKAMTLYYVWWEDTTQTADRYEQRQTAVHEAGFGGGDAGNGGSGGPSDPNGKGGGNPHSTPPPPTPPQPKPKKGKEAQNGEPNGQGSFLVVELLVCLDLFFELQSG